MKFDNFTSYRLLSGFIPDSFAESVKRQVTYYEYEERMSKDCFFHLLEKAELQFSSSCTVEIASPACAHLFYIYEGALELKSPSEESLRAQKNQFLFFLASETPCFQLRLRNCHFFHASITGLPIQQFNRLLPSVISYTPVALSVSLIPDCIFHLLHPDTDQSDILEMMYAKWLNDIFTELYIFTVNHAPMSTSIPKYMVQMKELLDNTYQQPHSLEQLEETFKKSRYRLCREFAQYFGMSPIQYLNHRRITVAKTLLLTTDSTIREVGILVGIENTTHFIHLFKKETGITPLAFRQNAPASIARLHYPNV